VTRWRKGRSNLPLITSKKQPAAKLTRLAQIMVMTLSPSRACPLGKQLGKPGVSDIAQVPSAAHQLPTQPTPLQLNS